MSRGACDVNCAWASADTALLLLWSLWLWGTGAEPVDGGAWGIVSMTEGRNSEGWGRHRNLTDGNLTRCPHRHSTTGGIGDSIESGSGTGGVNSTTILLRQTRSVTFKGIGLRGVPGGHRGELYSSGCPLRFKTVKTAFRVHAEGTLFKGVCALTFVDPRIIQAVEGRGQRALNRRRCRSVYNI